MIFRLFCLACILQVPTWLLAQENDSISLENCSIAPRYQAKVASDRPGVLAVMGVEEGDLVQKGQLIARLRDDVAQAIVETARKQTENDIDIRLAKKTNEVAAAEYDQALEANNPNLDLEVVTRYELRRLKLSSEQTRLQIEQAEHEAAILKLQFNEAVERLKELQIVSPITGVITRRFKTEGEALQQGSEIVEVTDFDVVKVEGFVDVIDYWRIKPGDSVVVRLEDHALAGEALSRTFNGKVVFVDGAVTPVVSKVRVWAEVDNEDRFLLPNLRATMEIQPTKTSTPEAAAR